MINIVVVDDSDFFRNIFVEEIEKTGKVKVIGQACNGVEALKLLKTVKPDIMVMDVEMPIMDGLECLKRVQEEYSFPVFMLSSLTSEGAKATIQALEYGAVDFLQKPTGGQNELIGILDVLVKKFTTISFKRRLTRFQSKSSAGKEGAELTKRDIEVIAIGSSTGGVQAIAHVLPALPAVIPPIVWVQHMPENFTKSLAERMNRTSAIEVKEAEDGEALEYGKCYLAPGGYYMEIKREVSDAAIHIYPSGKDVQSCLSCDMMFSSVGECFGSKGLGVILTGMGRDGAEGLKIMRDKGAFVIGQDEASCVVYGMPSAAKSRGAVSVEVDIKNVSDTIKKITGV